MIDFTPQEKMSDTETDQENEIFFREDIQQREGFNTKDKHQEENNQSYQEQDSTEQSNSEQDDKWLKSAFGRLVHMQSRMAETLEGVTKMISGFQKQNENSDMTQRVERSSSSTQQQNSLPSFHRNNNFAGEPEMPINSYQRPNMTGNNHKCNNSTKIPPFNGKDDWKVWFNRFETIANRQGWSDEDKLDHLLPKLQGSAGDFVFTQLPRETLENYDELIREINNRFRVIETPRTFAAKFSQRDQRQNETAEEYAADLKRLYDLAHKRRDGATRREDLVRRFLDGLRDEDVRWEVEYVKEPRDIDEAVYHVVNYIQTRKRHQIGSNRRQRPVRRTETEVTDSENESDTETVEYALRVPSRKQFKRQEKTEQKRNGSQPVRKTVDKNSNTEVKDDVIQALLQTIEELSKKVETATAKPARDDSRRGPIRCYNCNGESHFARECPNKPQQFNRPAYQSYRPYNTNNLYQNQKENRQTLNPNAQPFQNPLNYKGPNQMAGGRSQ